MKDMLLLTFSGVKGTVSIATILLIPSNLEQEYPLLLFLETSGSIGIVAINHDKTNSKEDKGKGYKRYQ